MCRSISQQNRDRQASDRGRKSNKIARNSGIFQRVINSYSLEQGKIGGLLQFVFKCLLIRRGACLLPDWLSLFT